MLRARALYDNDSETSDELAFLRDDVLEIIEKDYDGMEGWWLCGLKGKTGIVPANRLMIITISESPTDYDTPKTKYGSFGADRKPFTPSRINGRHSPTSTHDNQNSNFKQQNIKSLGNNLLPQDRKEFDDYCIPIQSNKRSSACSDSSQALSNNFEKYFTSYLKSEKDLNVIIMQLTNMIKKWYDYSNHDSRAQIVKTICVSYWKKIQAYIAEAAKTIASIKRLIEPETFKSFEGIKQSSSELENVLDYLNNFSNLKPEDKKKNDFLQQISALTSSLVKNVGELSNFFSHVDKEKLWSIDPSTLGPDLKSGNKDSILPLPPQRQTLNPYEDYDSPSHKSREIPSESVVKLVPMPSSTLHIDKEKVDCEALDYEKPNCLPQHDFECSSEAPDYDVPRGSDLSDCHSDGIFSSPDQSRPTSSEFLDYDCPKPQILVTSPEHKSSGSIGSVLSESSLVDDEADYDTPSNNSALVKMRCQELNKSRNQAGKCVSDGNLIKNANRSMNKIISFEELDYDIPSGNAESVPTKNIKAQCYLENMSQSEKILLKYYFPFISEELNNLLNNINYFENHLKKYFGNEVMQSTLLISDVRSLASCSHKVLFIVDSILKRLQSNIEFSNHLNFSCTKICEYLKNITNLVKQVIHPSSSVPLQNHLMAAIPDFHLHVQSMNRTIQRWKQ